MPEVVTTMSLVSPAGTVLLSLMVATVVAFDSWSVLIVIWTLAVTSEAVGFSARMVKDGWFS